MKAATLKLVAIVYKRSTLYVFTLESFIEKVLDGKEGVIAMRGTIVHYLDFTC